MILYYSNFLYYINLLKENDFDSESSGDKKKEKKITYKDMVRSKILDKIKKDNNESISSSEEYEKSKILIYI
jgi:hypothetical protein